MTDQRGGGVRPAFVIAALAAMVGVVALLTPEPTTSSGNGGMTTYSSALDGAQLVYDVARHLGWHVARRDKPLTMVAPPTTIQVLLDPIDGHEPVTAAETHVLLESVRAGGALLIAGTVESMEDSLYVRPSRHTGLLATTSPMTPQCLTLYTALPLTAKITAATVVNQVAWERPPPSEPVVLAKLRAGRDSMDMSPGQVMGLAVHGRLGDTVLAREAAGHVFRPAAVGFEFGAGRIVFIPSADLLENAVVRVCSWESDLLAIHALEYLSEGSHHRDVVVFDEYHHGYGLHPSTTRAVEMFVASTSTGQLLAQAIVAGLLLLMAAAPRPVVPHDPVRVARRSPLEQADALAHAYSTVHGTRTVATRLLGGVRRRRGGLQTGRTRDDDAFLTQVALANPVLKADVDLVRRALGESVEEKDLPAVGDAIRRIEAALSGFTPPPTRTT